MHSPPRSGTTAFFFLPRLAGVSTSDCAYRFVHEDDDSGSILCEIRSVRRRVSDAMTRSGLSLCTLPQQLATAVYDWLTTARCICTVALGHFSLVCPLTLSWVALTEFLLQLESLFRNVPTTRRNEEESVHLRYGKQPATIGRCTQRRGPPRQRASSRFRTVRSHGGRTFGRAQLPMACPLGKRSRPSVVHAALATPVEAVFT